MGRKQAFLYTYVRCEYIILGVQVRSPEVLQTQAGPCWTQSWQQFAPLSATGRQANGVKCVSSTSVTSEQEKKTTQYFFSLFFFGPSSHPPL